MDAALAPSFASFLRAARPELNARFAEARRQRPDLDGEAFARFLREAVDPLVRAGEAHFRAGALAAADALPPALALAAVRAPGGDWPELRRRLAAAPWFDPSKPVASGLRVVAHAGAFRGFGGLFVEPPVVAAAG